MMPPVPTAPDPTIANTAAAWYETHGPAVYGYLRFHLESADAAEDLTAEVFLRALRAADRYDPARGGPQAWLIGIARNLLRDHLRQHRRRVQVSLAALRDLQSDEASSEERVLREEAVAGLLGAVAALPAAERELVSLRYGSGLSAAEIGAVLGVRESAVRTRLWRALGHLRARLAEAG